MGRQKARSRRQRPNSAAGPHRPGQAGQPPAPPRPDTPPRESSFLETTFVVVTVLLTLVMLAVGIYAALMRRDSVLSAVTFLTGFAGVLLTAVQTYPSITRRIVGGRRVLVHMILIIFVLVSVPSTWVVLQRPVIKIAVSLPLLDTDKQDALAMLRAINMAIKDDSAKRIGSFDIEIIPFDDSNIDDGITFMSTDGQNTKGKGKLTDITGDPQIAGIIGPFNSGTALDEIPMTAPKRIPVISPSATLPCLTQPTCRGKTLNADGTFLRLSVTDTIRSQVLVDYLSEQLASATPADSGGPAPVGAIFSDQSSFGDGFRDLLADAWRDKYPKGELHLPKLGPNLDRVLDGLKPTPDVVLFAGTGSEGIRLHLTLQNQPWFSNGLFAAAATIMNDGFTKPLGNGIRGQLYAATPMPYDDTSPEVIHFNSDYYSAYGGQQPTPYSASAYDATQALLIAIRHAVMTVRPPVTGWNLLGEGQARALRGKTLEKLHNLNQRKGIDYNGIIGTFSFEMSGEVLHNGDNNTGASSIYRYYPSAEGDKRQGWNYEKPIS